MADLATDTASAAGLPPSLTLSTAVAYQAAPNVPSAAPPPQSPDEQKRKDITEIYKKSQEGLIGAEAAAAAAHEAKLKQYDQRLEDMVKAQGVSIGDLKPWDAAKALAETKTPLWDQFGSPAFLVAMLGSAFSARPMVTAMQAGGAAMKAINERDQNAYETAFKAWKDNTDLALKRMDMEHKEFEEIEHLRKDNIEEYDIKLRVLAAKYGNKRILDLIEAGAYPEIDKIIQQQTELRQNIETARNGLEEQKNLADAVRTRNERENPNNDPEKLRTIILDENRKAAEAKRAGLTSPSAMKGERIQQLMKEGLTFEEASKKVSDESKPGPAPLSKDTLRMLAQRILNGDKSAAQGLGWGNVGSQNRAALNEMVTELGKERGLSPEQIGKAIATANAAYAGETRGASALGQREALLTSAITSAVAVIPRVVETSKNVSRTEFSDINRIMLAGEERTGDPNVVRFGIALNTLVSAYARAIGGTSSVLTDSARHEARELLQRAWSKGQINAAVDQIKKEMDSELQGVQTAQKQFLKSYQDVEEHTTPALVPVQAPNIIKYDADGNRVQ